MQRSERSFEKNGWSTLPEESDVVYVHWPRGRVWYRICSLTLWKSLMSYMFTDLVEESDVAYVHWPCGRVWCCICSLTLWKSLMSYMLTDLVEESDVIYVHWPRGRVWCRICSLTSWKSLMSYMYTNLVEESDVGRMEKNAKIRTFFWKERMPNPAGRVWCRICTLTSWKSLMS